MRTRESAQLHTRKDGERSIMHEYCDPYTGEPVSIGGAILLAGVRHKNDLQAPTAVMSEHGFEHRLAFSRSKGGPPTLPGTQTPLEFACRVASDGIYAYSDGSVKDVVWPKSQHVTARPTPDDLFYTPTIGAPQAYEPDQQPAFMDYLNKPATDADADAYDDEGAGGVPAHVEPDFDANGAFHMLFPTGSRAYATAGRAH